MDTDRQYYEELLKASVFFEIETGSIDVTDYSAPTAEDRAKVNKFIASYRQLEEKLEEARSRLPAGYAKMSFTAQPLERTGRSDRIILQAKELSMKFEDSDTNLFDPLSFEVTADEKLFLAGPNGCGKSTLASLILRDYRPDSGKITYGGIDISLIYSTCWRSQIASIPQNSHLFNATIFDNSVPLTFG